ncbi:N-methylhydantoinase A/oxoprolinase/acetone carboxylase, beta subunit [Cribrihabitans marinus]|uniref:N-methylhydantoinase A/oxoprolinase/acetone carboxylase, beta subunit n=1 Tax=Cribrihabitans marinus TaxID=1227549 RepID=A0A1H7DHA9_9RHOB|nr:hydantoinase/oxoprolinase family protein [Cribrihabitans marinus]GGH39354.1 hydantoinase [Cribrihabitans marinus]SEK01106.1 N-methylhydantoinase A/oxoprolinase/acetone carboxylase, beta subunit [Cribrihabitans marinus]
MALAVGIDTGGTYTDAVLIRDETEVVASAKSLTTRPDLALGIGSAVQAVLDRAAVQAGEVSLTALSTTLATNALVEGQGGRVALVGIGFRPADLNRHGLAEALKGDPVLALSGGHTHAGTEAAPLDESALRAFLETVGEVSGYAVAGQFATRNPTHESRAARIIAEITGRPVTCSHQLSARLNGPKRALTAVLNARLIGMIDDLIAQAQAELARLGITAPLMVVRGDGALMSADQARARPIETILSGPAASIVGAGWLTGRSDALISDIGGTTTDIALIRDGRPAIDPEGALVGGFRTMVEAVAMRTHGLGGDSQVHPRIAGLDGGVTLGPRRVLPLSLLARQAPDVVHRALDRQLRATAPGDHDARFVRALSQAPKDGLGARECALLERIGMRVAPLDEVLRNRMDHGALERLTGRGLVQVAGITPTDASNVLGRMDDWDSEAARKGLDLVARKRVGSGNRLADGAETLARMIVDQLTCQTEIALLETAFSEERDRFDLPPEDMARHVLLRAGLSRHRGLLALDAALNIEVVGLGASAASYYPAVGDRLHCPVILPEHGDVANAIGAVVGRVTVRRSGTITTPAEGKYRVHLDHGPEDHADPEAALRQLEDSLRLQVATELRAAGAEEIRHSVARDIRTAQVEAREVFVEATLTVEGSGRPRMAVG